jgi:hypothetical protein
MPTGTVGILFHICVFFQAYKTECIKERGLVQKHLLTPPLQQCHNFLSVCSGAQKNLQNLPIIFDAKQSARLRNVLRNVDHVGFVCLSVAQLKNRTPMLLST